MDHILTLLAQAEQPAGGGLFGGMNQQWLLTIVMVGFIAFFYFVVVIPQNKKKKQMQQMLNEIKKGDRVVSIGGVHGKVSTVKDNEIVVKIDANAEITFEKSAIARVVTGNTNSNIKSDDKAKASKNETK